MQKLLLGLLFFAALVYAVGLFLPQQKKSNSNNTPTPTATVTSAPTTKTPTVSPTISDADALRLAVLLKSQIPESDFEYSVGSNNGQLARGSVRNENDMSGAAFFAGKVNGVWKVSYIGQGVPTCAEIAGINYPTTWISHCMNGNNTVQR